MSTASSGLGAGTAAYRCPVAMETWVYTIASDVYSLGLVLLQMLLGTPNVDQAKQVAK